MKRKHRKARNLLNPGFSSKKGGVVPLRYDLGKGKGSDKSLYNEAVDEKVDHFVKELAQKLSIDKENIFYLEDFIREVRVFFRDGLSVPKTIKPSASKKVVHTVSKKAVYTVKEVAQMFSVNAETIYRYIKSKELSSLHSGKSHLIEKQEISKFIVRHKVRKLIIKEEVRVGDIKQSIRYELKEVKNSRVGNYWMLFDHDQKTYDACSGFFLFRDLFEKWEKSAKNKGRDVSFLIGIWDNKENSAENRHKKPRQEVIIKRAGFYYTNYGRDPGLAVEVNDSLSNRYFEIKSNLDRIFSKSILSKLIPEDYKQQGGTFIEYFNKRENLFPKIEDFSVFPPPKKVPVDIEKFKGIDI